MLLKATRNRKAKKLEKLFFLYFVFSSFSFGVLEVFLVFKFPQGYLVGFPFFGFQSSCLTVNFLSHKRAFHRERRERNKTLNKYHTYQIGAKNRILVAFRTVYFSGLRI